MRIIKIAVVITANLPLIGQSKEGDVLRFKAVSVEEAHEELRKIHDDFNNIRERLDSGNINANINANYYKITVDGQAFDVSVEKL